MKNKPLSGVRILDIGTMIAGPVTATLLADFGAEVIKIERPDGGDTLRHIGPFVNGESLYWAVDGRNKKSITIDFRQKEGQELFKELVKISDVVIENFRPETLEKWNIGYDELKKINPEIIMCSITGYGQTGPYKRKVAFDRMAIAFSGLMYITGYSDRIPVKPGFSMGDYISAVYAAFSVMLSLFHRERSSDKTGQHIDLALYEALYRLTEVLTASYDKLGIVRERTGNHHFAGAPGDHFVSKDERYIIITCSTDDIFRRICNAIERPDLIENPKFKTHQNRWENIEEINGILSDWVSIRNSDEVIKVCEEEEIPCSMMYNIEDIVNDPHYQERESFVDIKHPRMGELKMQNVFPNLSETPGEINSLGPLLGEHNTEIFEDLLGVNKEHIEKLREKQIIS